MQKWSLHEAPSKWLLWYFFFLNLQVVEIDPSKEELFPGITAMKEELQVVLNAVTVWSTLDVILHLKMSSLYLEYQLL